MYDMRKVHDKLLYDMWRQCLKNRKFSSVKKATKYRELFSVLTAANAKKGKINYLITFFYSTKI